MTSELTAPDVERLAALKRRFVLTLWTCVLLVPITGYLLFFAPSDEASERAFSDTTPDSQPLISSEEWAYQHGKAMGLMEDSRILPRMKDDALHATAKAWVADSSEFAGLEAVGEPMLIAAFQEGYRAGYPGYFDGAAAYEAGQLYGLRADPALHPQFSRDKISALLERDKSSIQSKYDVGDDPAEWLVFKINFYNGYTYGWPMTREGVTRRAGEPLQGLGSE